MTTPTLPPEIEAAIDKYERAAIANAGALGAPDEHAAHTATWLAMTSAITSALSAAREAGRRGALEGAADVEMAMQALESIAYGQGVSRSAPRIGGPPDGRAADRHDARDKLRAAIAADKARAVEAAHEEWRAAIATLPPARSAKGLSDALSEMPLRPVLSREDAERLIGAYGTAVDKLAGFAEDPPANRDHYKAQLDDLYTRRMAARAALLAALTGAGGGR